MDRTKKSKQKKISNNKNTNNQKNKLVKNKNEENNEIIIELEISNNEKEKKIYILCDKDKLIEDNKYNDDYYKENNIDPPKEFNYFN